MMPVMMPVAGGAPDATAIPMQSGKATRNTTIEAKASWRRSAHPPGDVDSPGFIMKEIS
jgi:hypothetical protein